MTVLPIQRLMKVKKIQLFGETLSWISPLKGGLKGRWITGLLMLGLLTVGVYLAYTWSELAGIRSLRQNAEHQLDIYTGSLLSEVRRYDFLPKVMNLNNKVVDLLLHSADPKSVATANHYLDNLNREAKSSAIYVMDRQGLTLASSNWNQPLSFVGKNFAFRPYFQDALGGTTGRFYGIGTVSNEPGYYLAHGIVHGPKMIGVAALKVSLDKLGESWSGGDEAVLVVDENEVVFLSSIPEWKFKTLNRLSQETRKKLAATNQYSGVGSLEPIGFKEENRLSGMGRIVTVTKAVPNRVAQTLLRPSFLVTSRNVPETGWRLITLSNLGPVKVAARNTAFVTTFALGFLLILFLYLQQRRRAIAQSIAAKEALQWAHDDLERKVKERTTDLSAANINLQREIIKRQHAEQVLKDAMEELVQAGKMAALGQMASGITHELNQPLAALRTLSDNAVVFLQRGRISDVKANLEVICQLTDRMGKITGQLKTFARKSPLQLRPVSINLVISETIALMEQRIRNEGVVLELDIAPEGVCILGDENRLTQVLVNLFSNALDAMAAVPLRRLKIGGHQDGDRVIIDVHDSGNGIPDSVMSHLFEPFFTTKEQGAGLGLGLAISAGILRDMGGVLKARNHTEGGAEFLIELRLSQSEENYV
jgi:two-component system, NtrC family, C4-dicarboxylate transport sensor histidine kinase DctB